MYRQHGTRYLVFGIHTRTYVVDGARVQGVGRRRRGGVCPCFRDCRREHSFFFVLWLFALCSCLFAAGCRPVLLLWCWCCAAAAAAAAAAPGWCCWCCCLWCCCLWCCLKIRASGMPSVCFFVFLRTSFPSLLRLSLPLSRRTRTNPCCFFSGRHQTSNYLRQPDTCCCKFCRSLDIFSVP